MPKHVSILWGIVYIVPLYNVEKYIKECLNSLKKQSLKQIEVICIDDGSTDRSGIIADEYRCSGFPRIKIIHMEHKGLSAARNRGIDAASAEYLMFVDSDDWVAPDFCRIPYEACIKYSADIVFFGYFRTNKKGRIINKKEQISEKSGFVDKDVAIYNSGVWNKLYKRQLFDRYRYPEGRVYEEVATTHKLVLTAERIYQCEEQLYYYRRRKGSITQNKSSQKDQLIAYLEQRQDLKNCGYLDYRCESFLEKLALMYLSNPGIKDEKLYVEACELLNNLEGFPDDFGKRNKMKLIIWRKKESVKNWISHKLDIWF